MFNIKDSKLYTQIMEGLTRFFSLGEDATESDVHNALDGAAPLAEQLEAARLGVDEKLATITERLTAMEAQITALQSESEAKDERIAEQQTQIAELETSVQEKEAAFAELKSAHQKEVKTLAGQISTLKAGKVLEQDEGGDEYATGRGEKNDSVIPLIPNGDLQKLLRRSREN